VPASRSSDGAFTAANDGFQYMVTSSALVISSGTRVIRDETMLDFHRPGTATSTTTAPTATAPSAPTATAPTATAPTATVPSAPAAPTPTTPLPPPLAAEEGGGGG
jgi:hypothetical protein